MAFEQTRGKFTAQLPLSHCKCSGLIVKQLFVGKQHLTVPCHVRLHSNQNVMSRVLSHFLTVALINTMRQVLQPVAFILLTSIHFAAGASSGLLPPSDQRPKKKRSLIFSLHHQTTVGVTFSKSTVHYSQNLAPYKCQRVKEAYALEIQNSEHKGLIYTDASRCQWSAEEKWSSTLLRDPQHICSR